MVVVPRYELPETESAVEEAYVAFQLVDQPVVMVPRVEVELAKTLSPLQVLMSVKRVEEAEPVPMQVPLMEKHPAARLIPFANVEVAVELTFKFATERLPVNVLVEFAPETFKTLYMVEVAAVKFATEPIAKTEPGVVVPTPKFPAEVRRSPSVRAPLRSVANPRSPFEVEVAPPVPPWKMEKMEEVVVPVLCVVSSVLKAKETLVLEVAEPKLERMRAVVEAPLESVTSRRAWGEVVPMPT
jgi:hypothetical protein